MIAKQIVVSWGLSRAKQCQCLEKIIFLSSEEAEDVQ